MKKGFTLVELLIAIIILSILAAVSLPVYNKIIKRTGFKEVTNIVGLIRAGAKYYNLKYGVGVLAANETAWGALKLDKPTDSGTNLIYVITSADGDPALQVFYKGNMLYQYNLKTGIGINTGVPDAAYLPADLP